MGVISLWGVNLQRTRIVTIRLVSHFIMTLVHCKVTGELLCNGSQSLSLHRERFSPPPRVSDPTCITAHASCTCRGASRDRWLVVSFEVGGGEIVPGIPGACATRNFAYLVRGPWLGNSRCQDICRHGHGQGQVQYMHRPSFGWPTGYWWQWHHKKWFSLRRPAFLQFPSDVVTTKNTLFGPSIFRF